MSFAKFLSPASRFAVPLLLYAGGMSGCAPGIIHYPSLLPREIEHRSDIESAPATPVVARDSALEGDIAALARRLAAAAAGFADHRAAAALVAAKAQGAKAGDDLWLDAQSAIGKLTVYRGQSQSTLAEIDRMTADRAALRLPPYPALASLGVAASTQADSQSAAIDALLAMLGDVDK